MQIFLKRLKQHPWLLLLVGLSSLLCVLAIGQPQIFRQFPPLQATLPTPESSPIPLASAVTPTPSSVRSFQKASAPLPQSSSAATTPSSTAIARPGSPASRPSQQQAAINQRGMQELQASMALVDSMIEMHVAIAAGVSTLAIATSTPATVLNQEGQPLYSLAANRTYDLKAEGDRIHFGSWRLPSVVWLDIPADGLFTLGTTLESNRTYHGQLLVVAESGYLWAVNYVDMRQYLRSVVASEVSPNWDMEALKAQAVAARSYALVHYFRPATALYHLGATQRYQVYSGIAREADRTNQAVDATSGEFVSYRGGVVESLYAASDDIVASAFQGRGMSQLGALSLAKQGYTYEQILSNYYPDTGVSRIQVDQE
jgi:stage II sporulation protein D